MNTRRGFLLSLAGAVVSLLTLSFSPLSTLKMEEQERECSRRLSILVQERYVDPALRNCPCSGTPYLYTLDVDSNVVIRCPSGNGMKTLERNQWFVLE